MDTWRFVTIMFVALSMGMALCHLLEMPMRLGYDAGLWAHVTKVENTYRYFGPPLGAIIEAGAWISAVALAALSRHAPSGIFVPALLGAVCMVAAQLLWWTLVAPVNARMVGWTTEALPLDFDALRKQWEYAHAVRAVLQIGALGLIVAAALRGTRLQAG